MKRREYEEYMRSRGLPVEPPAGGKAGGKRPPFRDNDQDSYGSRDDDYGGSHVRNNRNAAPAPAGKKKGIPGLDFDPEDDQGAGYDLPPKKNIRQQQGGLGAAGRRGPPGRDDDDDDSSFTSGARRGRAGVPPLAPRRGGAAQDDYDDEPPARGPPRGARRGNSYDDDYESSDAGGGRGGGGRGGGKSRAPTAGADGDFVSVEQYDELSKLCDKLLAQQEMLQSEIEQQASLIKVRVSFAVTCAYMCADDGDDIRLMMAWR